MNPFQNYLQKISSFLEAPSAQKKPLIELIQGQTGILLTEKEIDVRDCIVYFKVSPSLKNELYMRKRKILESLNLRGAKIVDIR